MSESSDYRCPNLSIVLQSGFSGLSMRYAHTAVLATQTAAAASSATTHRVRCLPGGRPCGADSSAGCSHVHTRAFNVGSGVGRRIGFRMCAVVSAMIVVFEVGIGDEGSEPADNRNRYWPQS